MTAAQIVPLITSLVGLASAVLAGLHSKRTRHQLRQHTADRSHSGS